MAARSHGSYDVVVVGGGHNALVAACLLGKAGRSVLVLERGDTFGGAAVSYRPFAGVDVSLSRYAYLVSLFPDALWRALGIRPGPELRRRRVSSCTPDGERALLVGPSQSESRRSFAEVTGSPREWRRWLDWQRLAAAMARAVAPTLLEPLRPADEFRARAGGEAWSVLVEQPLGVSLRQLFDSDLVRGLVLTDGLIGTLACSEDASLRQNTCLLYHVVGNGHGRWDVPVGGMGALSSALAGAARRGGAELRSGAEVSSIDADGSVAEVRIASGERHRARVVLCGAAPALLDRLLGRVPAVPAPEGAQVKVNLALARLPRLASGVDPADAFCGTLHVNERMSQLDNAYEHAVAGRLPEPLPCELYCHSLTDPSVVGEELRARGVHTLTAFALQAPARLFLGAQPVTASGAGAAVLASLATVLDEPIEDCLLGAADGRPCVEVVTPTDLERELAMPGGHIFHGDLSWPWAEADDEVGRWGVETGIANVLVCGSGARRGGAVSGIGGHNAAMAALELLARPGD